MTDKGLQLSWHSQATCKYYCNHIIIEPFTSIVGKISASSDDGMICNSITQCLAKTNKQKTNQQTKKQPTKKTPQPTDQKKPHNQPTKKKNSYLEEFKN